MSQQRRRLQLLIAATTVALAHPASANGRFPAANQLVFDPGDSKHAAVRTTFGLLRTDDAKTYRWVCEKALGYEGTYDPAIAIAGGAVLVALPDGISRSRDGDCGFTRLGAPVAGEPIIDLAVDPTDPKHVVAITSLPEGAPPGARAKVFSSTDGGASFGAAVELPEDFKPYTVDVLGARIYASGRAPFAAFAMVVRSDDGASFRETTFNVGGGGAYIAAVDPTNPERLYLRVDGEPNDTLMFTGDGGQSFATIFTAPELLGVALAPDGARIAAGGPGVGVHTAGHDHTFTKLVDAEARCLVWNATGLYACGSEPFALARLDKELTPILRLADLEPLVCPAGSTTGDVCPPYWPAIERAIKPAPDAGAVDAAEGPTIQPASTPAGGCGCTYARTSDRGASAAFVLILAAVARRGISSVRPRLPCGRSDSVPPWPSASPSRSSS